MIQEPETVKKTACPRCGSSECFALSDGYHCLGCGTEVRRLSR